MGDSISEGTVEQLLKGKLIILAPTYVFFIWCLIRHYNIGPGEYVEADETVAKIETDKVTVDIPSPKSGVIKEYLAAEGDVVEVGADFFVIDTAATQGSAGATPPK